MTSVDMTNISVVTNTYNRPLDLVARSLRSSLKQSEYLTELILIDQNNPPLQLPSDITSHPKFRRILSESNCVSAARNSLLKENLEGWIIFCDDDGYFDKDYMTTFIKITNNHPSYQVIAGSIMRDDTLEYYSPRHKIGGDLNKFMNTKLLMGSNFAVKSEVFRQLNGFDERFGAGSYWGSGEETDFAWKAHFFKIPMLFEKDLKVLHIKPYASDFTSSCKKAFFYGRGKGALVSKWLIQNKRITVIGELFEMITLPFFQIAINLIKLNLRSSFYPVASFLGRIVGFFKMAQIVLKNH